MHRRTLDTPQSRTPHVYSLGSEESHILRGWLIGALFGVLMWSALLWVFVTCLNWWRG